MDVKTLLEKSSIKVSSKLGKLCELKDIRQGCVVEVNFTVPKGVDADKLDIGIFRNNVRLPGLTSTLENVSGGKNVRLVYKFPIIMDNVAITISSPGGATELKDLAVYQHQDMAMNLTRNIWTGERHKGGVTFDVIAE